MTVSIINTFHASRGDVDARAKLRTEIVGTFAPPTDLLNKLLPGTEDDVSEAKSQISAIFKVVTEMMLLGAQSDDVRSQDGGLENAVAFLLNAKSRPLVFVEMLGMELQATPADQLEAMFDQLEAPFEGASGKDGQSADTGTDTDGSSSDSVPPSPALSPRLDTPLNPRRKAALGEIARLSTSDAGGLKRLEDALIGSIFPTFVQASNSNAVQRLEAQPPPAKQAPKRAPPSGYGSDHVRQILAFAGEPLSFENVL